jgi:hypothetical protein
VKWFVVAGDRSSSPASRPRKLIESRISAFLEAAPKAEDQEVQKMFKNLLPDSQKITKTLIRRRAK